MPTQNVNLSSRLATFIRESIATGRYQNASEVVRAGLRLLEQRDREDQLRLDALRRIAEDGFAALDRGEGQPMTSADLDNFFAELDQRINDDR